MELNYKNKIEKYVDIKNLYESNKDYYNILLKEKNLLKLINKKKKKKKSQKLRMNFLNFSIVILRQFVNNLQMKMNLEQNSN